MEGVEGPPVVEATPDIFAGVEPEAAPLTSEDIFGGVSPEVPLDPVDPSLRPRGRVETDILESQAGPMKWVDPDTGLKPAPGKIRTREEIRRDATQDLTGGWGSGPEINKLVKKISAQVGVDTKKDTSVTEEDMTTLDEFMEGAGALGEAAKAVNKFIETEKLKAAAMLVDGIRKRTAPKPARMSRYGRSRREREFVGLNPTPLSMGK